MTEPEPCAPHPTDVGEVKTIGVRCETCGSWECWIGYLRWERRKGIELNRAAWEGLEP